MYKKKEIISPILYQNIRDNFFHLKVLVQRMQYFCGIQGMGDALENADNK